MARRQVKLKGFVQDKSNALERRRPNLKKQRTKITHNHKVYYSTSSNLEEGNEMIFPPMILLAIKPIFKETSKIRLRQII